MDSSASTVAPDTRRRPLAEVALAGLLAALGIVLTSGGIFGHVPTLVAPGAACVLAGGAWLGNALARADVRLVPPPSRTEPH